MRPDTKNLAVNLPEDLDVDEELMSKVEGLMRFFDQSGIDYDKFDPSRLPRLDFGDRKAYPNVEVYQHVPGQHDTQKWLQAVREIYHKEHNGESRVNAIRRVTSGWNIMETYDFLNWVKFYESGDHMKYKFAQLWYENPQMGPGYFLQVKKDPEPVETTTVSDQDVSDARDEANLDSERRHVIEKQRNKIIGRLDSAEKLLRSPDGQIFSGKEFESLLESIYQLKKKIQMVNKISSSTRLYEDMIIREANVLRKNGFSDAADMLYVMAQTPGQAGQDAQGDKNAPPNPPPPASPGDPSGAGNPGPPSGGAGTPAQPDGNVTFPQSDPSGQPQVAPPKGIGDFLRGLKDSGFSGDEQIADDELEVMDTEDDLIITEAQIVPKPIDEPLTTSPAPAPLDPSPVSAPTTPVKPSKPSKPQDESLEVTEDDLNQPPSGQAGQAEQADPVSDPGLNNKIDSMFANVTIADIVAELEDLSKIFKVREIPRRISKVDMMLDGKGLASYFPSLSEAQNKALEANNYISTRVEDILSKLRGAITTKEIDLKGGEEAESPEVAGIKGKLKSDEDKEKARKQMRKDQEEAELAGNTKETPDVEIEEDLGGTPPPPKAPPRPAPQV